MNRRASCPLIHRLKRNLWQHCGQTDNFRSRKATHDEKNTELFAEIGVVSAVVGFIRNSNYEVLS